MALKAFILIWYSPRFGILRFTQLKMASLNLAYS